MEKKLSDVHTVLGQAGNAIEQWAAPSVHQKESLKVFFLVLQVCHYLMCGQVLAFVCCQFRMYTIYVRLFIHRLPYRHHTQLLSCLCFDHFCVYSYMR